MRSHIPRIHLVLLWILLTGSCFGCIEKKRKIRTGPEPWERLPTPAEIERGREAERFLRKHRNLFDDTNLSALCALRGLRDLDLSYTQVTGPGLICIRGMKKLEYVNLHGTQIGDEVMGHLQALRKLQIVKLTKTRITGWNIDSLQNLRYLERVDLSENRLAPGVIGRLAKLTRLRRLSLRGVIGQLRLSRLKGMPLTHLDLARTTPHREQLRQIFTLTRLKGLNLSHVNLAADSNFGALPLLEELYVASCGIDDSSVMGIGSLSRLQHLDLYGNKVTYKGLRVLKGLRHLHSLVLSAGVFISKAVAVGEVSFIQPVFSGEGFKSISWPSSLRTLSITRADIGDGDLAFLQKLKNLRELDLSYTRVTQKGMSFIRQAIPGLRLLWIPSKRSLMFGDRHATPKF